MTNKDKYLKDEVDVNDFLEEFNDFCAMQTDNQTSIVRLAQFLSREVKPTLTEDEKVILRNIDSDYTSIGKERHGWLYVKDESDIEFRGFDNLYHHLFQFIKPRRRI